MTGRCGSAAGAWRAISPSPRCARAGNRTPASRPPRSRSGARRRARPHAQRISGGRTCATARWPGSGASARSNACGGSCAASITILPAPPGSRAMAPGCWRPGHWRWRASTPGPLARAARQLARSAEHPAHRRTPPPRARPRSSALALFLLAGARPDSTAGWFLLARQLSLLGSDLARLHQLRGELDRAREIETGLGAELELVRTGFAAESGRGSPAEPEAAAELRPVRDPIPAPRPGAQSHDHEAEAARRLSDATRRRPRRQR